MPQEFARPQAVIFDWAGTTVDYGSRAPVMVVFEVFRRRGIEISEAEARGPMGMAKRDHIAAVIRLPRIAARWREVHGHAPGAADVSSMYAEFLPLQKDTLARCGADVIPGVAQAIDRLRSRGIKIGSTTGYTRELMNVVAPIAACGGYTPDVIVCSDDVSAGRPAPWMNLRAAEQLGIDSLSSVVVVDDTPVGIQAGRNAGATTIGISQTGNELGLSQAEVTALSPGELESRLVEIEHRLQLAGAHRIIKSVADLPECLAAT